MRQVPWIFAMVAATTSVALAGDSPALAEAKQRIAAGDFKAAASLLEDALGSATAADRQATVDLLKESYRGLIRDAKAAGKTRAAFSLEDDLAILESASPAPVAKPTEPSAPTPPPAPKPTPPPADDPAPAPKPSEAPTPTPSVETTPLPRSEAPALDKPLELPLVGPATAALAGGSIDPNVARAAADVPDPTPAEPDELARADALFTEKRYDEAGAIYADLARKGRLPAVRNKVWAYCRWSAIVARISDGPKSDAEWDLIDHEIQSVERLTPDHWFVDYLKDLAADVRAGKRPVPKKKTPAKISLRGAEPEEAPGAVPAPAARRPKVDPQARRAGGGTLDLPTGTDDLPAPAPVPPVAQFAPPLDGSEAAAPAATAPVSWQMRETANFRVYHVDAALAEKAAVAAEAVRASQGKRWGSPATRSAWEPKCDIYLYPTAADFARMTGQPASSPGFSTMGIGGGKVVARRVNLRADHPQLITAVLPHEVAHVVLADVFPDQQIPRWADEGMAVLAEPPAEQTSRCSELGGPLADNRVFPLETLMSTDYPQAKDWNLFYAQSVSLTRFLMDQGGPAQFVAFIKDSQDRGPDTALRATYRIAGFRDLESRWLEHARGEADNLLAADAAAATR